MESIAIGSDHAGFPLKEAITQYLTEQGIPFQDVGCYSVDSVDYPAIAQQVVEAMIAQNHTKGILCCGSGIGVSIAANRYPQIRAALANDLYAAKMSRMHNDANVLCMGSRVVAPALALEVLDTWLNTPFEGGRHQRRVDQLETLAKEKAC
jgi:ribose 5-phosphate isomerase B